MQGQGTRRTASHNARERPDRRTAAKARAASPKKRRRLSKAGRLLATVGVLLLIVCAIGGAVWLILPVGAVKVIGKTPYTQEKIMQVSGISVGDRLLGVDERKTARLLETNLPYISKVSVLWRLPNTLVLQLQKATPIAAVPRTGGFAILDQQGKVLEIAANLQAFPNVPAVTGPDVGAYNPGQTVRTAAKGKLAAALTLLNDAKAAGIAQVTSADVHDQYQITFGYQNRITVLVGTSADIEEKMRFAAYMLTKQLQASDKGTLDVSQTVLRNQAVFSPAS